MLYGHKETVDNRIASIVPAADSISEYDDWVKKIIKQEPHPNYSEIGTSKLMDHMFRDELSGYKRPVLIIYHLNEEQRKTFFGEWDIKEVKSQSARDRQADMIHNHKQEIQLEAREAEIAAAKAEGREAPSLSIEELHGLVDHDPWDRRTDEQKAEDAAIKEQMKEMQKKGNISSDSFGGANEQREDRAKKRGIKLKPSSGSTHVTDIRTSVDEDGNINIDNALAHKFGGEVDSKLGEERAAEYEAKASAQKKGKKVFSPDDFAEVLRGDGSANHLDVKPDIDPETNQKVQPSRVFPTLSEAAEAARKIYQQEQQEKAEQIERERREEQDIIGKKEQEEGIFRGADLIPDQLIPMIDLPESLRKAFEAAKITDEKLPLKNYPYNSMIGDLALLPKDTMQSETSLNVGLIDNLNIEGTIALGNPSVLVVSKKDDTQPGWAVYVRQKKIEVVKAEEEAQYDVMIVCIR